MLGAAPPSPGRLSLGAAPPLPLFREMFLFNSDLSFVLHLALATLEHAQISAILVYSELHLRVIIKLLAFFFLFVLRLRTGNDLRDQADLASTRSVTTGSWFSDCIGASDSLVVVGS